MQALVVQQSVNDVEAMTWTKDERWSAGLDNTSMAEQEKFAKECIPVRTIRKPNEQNHMIGKQYHNYSNTNRQ